MIEVVSNGTTGNGPELDAAIAAGMTKAGLASARRHVFLCLGPDCCNPSDGEAVWELMKRRLREEGVPAMRTKAQCFRICGGGPWMVVYPEGSWYGGVTPERFERILREHLVGGHPVAEWIAAKNALCGG